ncbi:hypothetical protein OUZ56_000111 [Daphnia magna]|uniref:Uncharacterized protein n=1 Tax=Daphnia magna TaxID=35525 RepID=A0ABQ9ZYR3_9CRUS|nr:hypothetical protein OUZ56_000111 [Daphnia magna]
MAGVTLIRSQSSTQFPVVSFVKANAAPITHRVQAPTGYISEELQFWVRHLNLVSASVGNTDTDTAIYDPILMYLNIGSAPSSGGNKNSISSNI